MDRPLTYDVNKAASVLGMSPWLLRKAIKSGAVPTVPKSIAGNRVLIPVALLERLINAERVAS